MAKPDLSGETIAISLATLLYRLGVYMESRIENEKAAARDVFEPPFPQEPTE